MQLDFPQTKHLHDLNFDEDSSSEQEPLTNLPIEKQKKKKSKIFDFYQIEKPVSRDIFSANKITKGLFFNEQEYNIDHFQVICSKKPNSFQLTNQMNDPVKTQQYFKQGLQSSPANLIQSHSSKGPNCTVQNQNLNEDFKRKDEQTNRRLGLFQSVNLIDSKKKMLELDFSASSSSEDEKQDNSSQQEDKDLVRKKETDEPRIDNRMNLQSKSKKSQANAFSQPQNFSQFTFPEQYQLKLLEEIPQGMRVQAFISRNREGLNLFQPQYQVIIEASKQQILHVKKEANFMRNVYKIYNRALKGSNQYFGKLKSDLAGNVYQIYQCKNGVHEYLKGQIYVSNDSNSNRQPRHFVAFILAEGYYTQDLTINGIETKSLKKLYHISQNQQKLSCFQTRRPIFSQQLQGFALDFSGRVNLPSIKNFILEDLKNQKEVLMFGKMDKNNFRFQISKPLNCIVGAALAMIQFQNKLMK